MPETEEQRQAREEMVRRMAQRQEEARGAQERAEALLKTRLGAWAYRRLGWNGHLMRVSVLWPGVRYLIPRRGVVKVIERGRVTTELCVISDQGEPDADRLMAVLDLIESGQEERLWEMANVFPKRR